MGRCQKTERFCKRYAIQQALNNDNWEIHLGGPTRQQAKEILWEDVKKRKDSVKDMQYSKH